MNKNFLTLEEMGISFKDDSTITKPIEPYTKSIIDTYISKVSDKPVFSVDKITTNKYSCMCDALKQKADEVQPILPMSSNEIINRIINKLYDLAREIELIMQGY